MLYKTLALLLFSAPFVAQADDCKQNGQRLWDALQDKLKDDNAADETRFDQTLDRDYVDEVTSDATPDADAFKNLFQKDLKLDFNQHFAEHNVRSNNGESTAFLNMYNTIQGTMVGVYNYKEYDLKGTMPFSEVMFQCFKKECDEEEELKKFQLAAVSNVVNDAYKKAIKAIYESHGWSKIRDTWRKFTFADNKDDYLTLLGTPKLGFIPRMLADHSVAFGKRVPTDLYTHYIKRSVYVQIDEFQG
ncbi:MAG: hypothetical protein Q9181_001922 [Wetmoreana brouardii]